MTNLKYLDDIYYPIVENFYRTEDGTKILVVCGDKIHQLVSKEHITINVSGWIQQFGEVELC